MEPDSNNMILSFQNNRDMVPNRLEGRIGLRCSMNLQTDDHGAVSI